ncbi:NADP-dependent oxidoreductase [Novosphingobium sp.]|uniref:NADP-dependent oxidoreductase n=1 Tax=Novosphingobium sp. TaxID=1874826 RepID=UPI0025E583EA|nr:NADP-dependent oxidoreductase [Novosphingobium sp.]
MFIRTRPDGAPVLTDFGIEDETIADVASGQVLVKVDTLSMDAWIRTTLNDAGMHETGDLGSTIRAFGIGQVIASSDAGYAEGDWTYGMLSAQTLALIPSSQLTKVEPEPGVSPQEYIGLLGITTGLTAWVGLIAVGEVQAGDVVLVSGAAGAVGSCVVQFAKARGAHVIGIAGGAAKCAYLVDQLGADAAIDYKAGDVGAQLGALAPDGIDLFFDNVGGSILDAALDNLRPSGGARVVICGAISQYQHLDDVAGPKLYLRLAERNASMRGFVVSHHAARFTEAKKEISALIRDGKARLPEYVVSPIDKFPDALLMLFSGQHTGNLVVKP